MIKNVIFIRNHKTEERPNFTEVSAQLSFSNSKLLDWSQEDKSEFPEASRLGANLTCAEKLYKDLQLTYKVPPVNNTLPGSKHTQVV